MPEPKFTSFTTADFMNDVDMDLFIDAVEKTAPLWVKEMKSRGLLKFSLNRVWNQGEVFRVVMTYEYKDRQSFEANRAYLDDTFGKKLGLPENLTNSQIHNVPLPCGDGSLTTFWDITEVAITGITGLCGVIAKVIKERARQDNYQPG